MPRPPRGPCFGGRSRAGPERCRGLSCPGSPGPRAWRGRTLGVLGPGRRAVRTEPPTDSAASQAAARGTGTCPGSLGAQARVGHAKPSRTGPRRGRLPSGAGWRGRAARSPVSCLRPARASLRVLAARLRGPNRLRAGQGQRRSVLSRQRPQGWAVLPATGPDPWREEPGRSQPQPQPRPCCSVRGWPVPARNGGGVCSWHRGGKRRPQKGFARDGPQPAARRARGKRGKAGPGAGGAHGWGRPRARGKEGEGPRSRTEAGAASVHGGEEAGQEGPELPPDLAAPPGGAAAGPAAQGSAGLEKGQDGAGPSQGPLANPARNVRARRGRRGARELCPREGKAPGAGWAAAERGALSPAPCRHAHPGPGQRFARAAKGPKPLSHDSPRGRAPAADPHRSPPRPPAAQPTFPLHLPRRPPAAPSIPARGGGYRPSCPEVPSGRPNPVHAGPRGQSEGLSAGMG